MLSDAIWFVWQLQHSLYWLHEVNAWAIGQDRYRQSLGIPSVYS